MAQSQSRFRSEIWFPSIASVLAALGTAIIGYQASKLSSDVEQLRIETEKTTAIIEAQNDTARTNLERWKFIINIRDDIVEAKNSPKQKYTLAVAQFILTGLEFDALKQAIGDEAQSSGRSFEVQENIKGANSIVIAALISQLNGASKSERLSATDRLISQFSNSQPALTSALDVFSKEKIDMLTANGRINILVYLSNVEKDIWTDENRVKLKKAIKLMESRHKDNVSKIGPKTRKWINEAKRNATLN